MKLRLALLLVLLLSSAVGAAAHFHLGKGKFWVQIRSFDRTTGMLEAKDLRHNIRWEMFCQLPLEQRQHLVAERGVMVKMRFQKDQHTAELQLGRPDARGHFQLAWVVFIPQRQILL